MILPSEVIVELHDANGRPIPHVLVALDFLWHANPYYSHSFGLSDNLGQVKSSGGEILATFRAQQLQFPMDLKVPLAECDATAQVRIMGGAEFLAHRDALDPRWVEPEWVTRWRQAQNGGFESNRTIVSLGSSEPVQVQVTLRPERDRL